MKIADLHAHKASQCRSAIFKIEQNVMPQLLVLVRVGGPQLKYDYLGGHGLKRLRTTALVVR